MSLLKSSPKNGVYLYSEIAKRIAKAQNFNKAFKRIFIKEMQQAMHSGALRTRHPYTFGPIDKTSPYFPSTLVTESDVNSWLLSEGRNYRLDTKIKQIRITQNKAILLSFFEEGVGKSIESVWNHMKANAGKPGFPFVRVGPESAVYTEKEKAMIEEDKKRVSKKALEKVLHRLIQQQNH